MGEFPDPLVGRATVGWEGAPFCPAELKPLVGGEQAGEQVKEPG